MTMHADSLAAYRKVRQIRFRLSNALVQTLDKLAYDWGGQKLGILQRGTLVFDSEEEMHVLMDFCLYNYRVDGRNAVERYLVESPPPPDSEELAVLESMREAHYSLFRILDIERGVGLTVHDLWRDETSFLFDIGLSTSARKNFIMATRAIPMDGFLTTGGAALPLSAAAMDKIEKELKRTFDLGAIDFARLTPDQEADIAALVIRACLATGVTSQVAYRDPSHVDPRTGIASGDSVRDAPPQRLPIIRSRPGKIGRNERCPCGSGKKYKYCCGINVG